MGSIGGKQSVQTALNKISSLTHIDKNEIANPLYDDNDPNLRLVDVIDRNVEGDNGVYEDVDVNKLRTIQATISESNLKNIIKSYEGIQDTPDVIKYGQYYYVTDGNHRAVAAKLLNKQKIRVHVKAKRA